MAQKLSKIVSHYCNCYRTYTDAELDQFRQCSLEEAVTMAGLAVHLNGKRFSHQRRIPKLVLQESSQCLVKVVDQIQYANTFDEIYIVVRDTIGGIKGIGKLTIYDTALRIGAKRELEPDKVYLHAGTKRGARSLGIKVCNLYLTMNEIPIPLRKLKPLEIEDVLCIYKKCFECTISNCPLPQKRCGDNRGCNCNPMVGGCC